MNPNEPSAYEKIIQFLDLNDFELNQFQADCESIRLKLREAYDEKPPEGDNILVVKMPLRYGNGSASWGKFFFFTGYYRRWPDGTDTLYNMNIERLDEDGYLDKMNELFPINSVPEGQSRFKP